AASCPVHKTKLRFGAIFGSGIEELRKRNALHYALASMSRRYSNNDSTIFCRHDLLPIVTMLAEDEDSFQANQAVCRMLEGGALALIGPHHACATSEYFASMATATQTPQLDLRPMISAQESASNAAHGFVLNLYPSLDHISLSVIAAIDYFKWQDVLIVYENDESLFRLESILRNRRYIFRIKRYVASQVYSLLSEIDSSGWCTMVLDLSLEATAHFLRAATNRGLMNRRYHYILANLDAMTLDLEDYRHNHVNLTAFRVVPGNWTHYNSVLADMRDWSNKQRLVNPDGVLLTRGGQMTLGAALIYDAVQVLASALASLSLSRHIKPPLGPSCDALMSFNGTAGEHNNALRSPFGGSLMNYLHSVDLRNGLTGRLRFDSKKSRQAVSFDLYHLKANGPVRFANWTPRHGLQVFSEPYDLAVVYPLKNKVLRVVALAAQPFIWVKREYHNRYLINGHIRPDVEFHRQHLEGFCIDMMELIANRTGMDWVIYRSPDDKYGICVELPCDKNKQTKQLESSSASMDQASGSVATESSGCNCEWNGMVRELIDGRADIALGSFTITYEREKAIDFTKPFMNLGISILFKKPKGEKPGLFSFLNPLAVEIWLYVVAAYLLVTLMIYALARFSPYEWVSPHPCDEDIGYLVNSFSLSNSFWFTVGTLMQQGSNINPRAVSTRIVAGIWWFFTLIIISSYTANLAAFLTVERMVSPIESADDLSKQTAIEYGVLAGGSTETFFETSHIETYARMAKYMRSRKHLKTATTMEAIERVKRGGYAFLMESAMIEYHIERQCNLVQIGGLIDSKGYGLGIRPNREELRDELTLKILELQRDQQLQALKNKWWKETGTCRGKDPQETTASELGMHNVGGIFVVLVCGLLLAVFVAVVEFVWNTRKNAEAAADEGRSLWSEMSSELRFSLNCYGSSRRRRHHRRRRGQVVDSTVADAV
uniref:Glutamate receptor n=1 Tax=Macrostomum lignano TaxID=282301 RepID=A0A1I8I3N7_9PLAT